MCDGSADATLYTAVRIPVYCEMRAACAAGDTLCFTAGQIAEWVCFAPNFVSLHPSPHTPAAG